MAKIKLDRDIHDEKFAAMIDFANKQLGNRLKIKRTKRKIEIEGEEIVIYRDLFFNAYRYDKTKGPEHVWETHMTSILQEGKLDFSDDYVVIHGDDSIPSQIRVKKKTSIMIDQIHQMTGNELKTESIHEAIEHYYFKLLSDKKKET
ncbi:MAG: hypothetical protein ACOX4N_00150 [Dethiobacteraceae bacterium]|jgi:hypothetical protein